MSNATIPSDAISCLSTWINRGLLSSQVDHFLREVRNTQDNWYAKLRDSEGLDAAEAELWLQTYVEHHRDVAAAIEPVGEALLALAEAEDPASFPFVHYVSSAGLAYPSASETGPEGRLLTVFNPELPWCSACRPLSDADLFSPGGTLRLKAITLLVDTDAPRTTKLGLVLPLRQVGPRPTDGFCVTEFGLDGKLKVSQHMAFVLSDSFLRSVVGVAARGDALVSQQNTAKDNDQLLGFAGASQLLITHLPQLATYLKAVARLLDPDHHH